MSSSTSTLLAFLQREKDATRERIRQCQIFLDNEPLLESEAATRGTLRESLEQIRANAEEDFGSFLHLLTVIKPEAEEAKTAVPKVGLSPVRLGGAAAEEKRSQSPFVSEDELDPSTMFEHGGQAQLTNLVMNAGRGEVNGHHGGEKDSEELAEEDDYVPNLPPSAINATSAGVARTSGRFVHRPVPTASDDSAAGGYARSLPVTVPITEGMLTRNMLPPELREEDMTPPEDILSSIQTIAKSLHREPFSVEQPRAQRARIFSGAE